jgi:peptidoglycan hydrolase CwlO-like protein
MHLHFHIANVSITTDNTEVIKAIAEQTGLIKTKFKVMANELETLTAEVAETNTVVDSAITLLKGLKAALDAAGTDPAALAALSASLDNKQSELAAAISENTPAAEDGGEGEEGTQG